MPQSEKINFEEHASLGMKEGWTVHVVQTMVDGLPALGIRVLFDSDEQRQKFIDEYLESYLDDVDEIPEEVS